MMDRYLLGAQLQRDYLAAHADAMGLETAGALQRRRLEATPRPPTPTSGERREKDRELSGSSPASASSAAAAAQAGAFGRSPSASPARSRSPAVSWRSVFSARPNSDENRRPLRPSSEGGKLRAGVRRRDLAGARCRRAGRAGSNRAPTVIKRLLVLLLAAAACRHLPPPDAPASPARRAVGRVRGEDRRLHLPGGLGGRRGRRRRALDRAFRGPRAAGPASTISVVRYPDGAIKTPEDYLDRWRGRATPRSPEPLDVERPQRVRVSSRAPRARPGSAAERQDVALIPAAVGFFEVCTPRQPIPSRRLCRRFTRSSSLGLRLNMIILLSRNLQRHEPPSPLPIAAGFFRSGWLWRTPSAQPDATSTREGWRSPGRPPMAGEILLQGLIQLAAGLHRLRARTDSSRALFTFSTGEWRSSDARGLLTPESWPRSSARSARSARSAPPGRRRRAPVRLALSPVMQPTRASVSRLF